MINVMDVRMTLYYSPSLLLSVLMGSMRLGYHLQAHGTADATAVSAWETVTVVELRQLTSRKGSFNPLLDTAIG